MSTSMYEIFSWGQGDNNGAAVAVLGAVSRRPKQKLTLSLAGSSINIDDPAPAMHDGSNRDQPGSTCKKLNKHNEPKHVVFSLLNDAVDADDDKYVAARVHARSVWHNQSILFLVLFQIFVYHFSLKLDDIHVGS